MIPTYNERENLEELITRVNNALKEFKYEVVVVDDNSPDGTAELAEELSKRYPIKVVRRPGKLGLASAVLDGVKACSGELVVVMDADLQHPPELIPKMVYEALNGYDLVIASRYVRGGVISGWGIHRRLVSRIAVVLAKLLIPNARRINDPISGYFLFRREVVSSVISDLSPKGFKILLEVLVKGKYSKVVEVPYEFKVRRRGRSKLGLSELINYVVFLITLTPYLRLIKYLVVGAVGTAVNLGVLYCLRYSLSMEHFIASAIAIEASIINNFILHEHWTFRDRRIGRWVSRLVKFHGSTLVAVVTQYAISQALHYGLSIESTLAQLIGIVIGFIVNYVLSNRYVWAADPSSP